MRCNCTVPNGQTALSKGVKAPIETVWAAIARMIKLMAISFSACCHCQWNGLDNGVREGNPLSCLGILWYDGGPPTIAAPDIFSCALRNRA